MGTAQSQDNLYGGPYDFHDVVIIAHAVAASIAACILIPAGILTARWARGSPRWFPIHAALQGMATLLIIAALALGIVAVRGAGDGALFTGSGNPELLHHKLGLSVTIIVASQAVFGIIAHSTKAATSVSGRSALRWLHMAFGIATVILLYATVYSGFEEWGLASDAETAVPRSVRIVFWVFVALPAAAWVAGLFLARRASLGSRGSSQEKLAMTNA